METVFIVAVLVVLACSLAGNVFQARRYDKLARWMTNPPDGYFEEHAVEAAERGEPEVAGVLARASVAKHGGEVDPIQRDRSITP